MYLKVIIMIIIISKTKIIKKKLKNSKINKLKILFNLLKIKIRIKILLDNCNFRMQRVGKALRNQDN